MEDTPCGLESEVRQVIFNRASNLFGSPLFLGRIIMLIKHKMTQDVLSIHSAFTVSVWCCFFIGVLQRIIPRQKKHSESPGSGTSAA